MAEHRNSDETPNQIRAKSLYLSPNSNSSDVLDSKLKGQEHPIMQHMQTNNRKEKLQYFKDILKTKNLTIYDIFDKINEDNTE